jgi:integrase
VPPHIVREIVGPSDIEVTMTIYAHVSLDEKRAALPKLGDALAEDLAAALPSEP